MCFFWRLAAVTDHLPRFTALLEGMEIHSTAARDAASEFANAAAMRPHIVGAALARIAQASR
jgi:hypothetical protein